MGSIALSPRFPGNGINDAITCWTEGMKKWPKFVIPVLFVYIVGYATVRTTYEMHWFDKTTEETGAYTFFNSLSVWESTLHAMYLPLLEVDLRITNRPYEKDKW